MNDYEKRLAILIGNVHDMMELNKVQPEERSDIYTTLVRTDPVLKYGQKFGIGMAIAQTHLLLEEKKNDENKETVLSPQAGC